MQTDATNQYYELEKCQEIVADTFEAAVNSLIRHGQKVSLKDLGGLMDTLADALYDRAKPHRNWLESNGFEVDSAPYPANHNQLIEREHKRLLSEVDFQTSTQGKALRPVATNPATRGDL